MKTGEIIYNSIKSRFDALAKPIDGLGRFEDMICSIGAIQGREEPDISRKALVIMCADNGVTKEGISQTDGAVTAKVAALMAKGESSACLMARQTGAEIIPVDIGIDCQGPFPGLVDKKIMAGTKDIVRQDAMPQESCLAAIKAGEDIVIECAGKGIGIIATGEMGIGNTTTSTALFCAITGCDPGEVTGRGAGLSDVGLMKKINVIETALSYHGYDSGNSLFSSGDVLTALCALGGLDIAGLVGVYKGCADNNIPVIVDGAISAVAALVASLIFPGCEKAMLPSHTGREKITARILDILKMTPVINGDMALGEGTGAVMMFPLLDMAMAVFDGLSRFEDADIIPYGRFDK